MPYAPCMEYLPTLARPKSPNHVGKYTSTMEPFWLCHQFIAIRMKTHQFMYGMKNHLGIPYRYSYHTYTIMGNIYIPIGNPYSYLEFITCNDDFCEDFRIPLRSLWRRLLRKPLLAGPENARPVVVSMSMWSSLAAFLVTGTLLT